MKIQSNYHYYNQIIPFTNRIRMHNRKSVAPKPNKIEGKNNPNLSIYIYEDANQGIDIDERSYDSFTGLRDKQYLFAVLNKMITDDPKNQKNFSVAMFDMDNFKSVNELLGYETGDDFIKFVSSDINGIAQNNALHAYRFGGEEFVIIFNNDNMQKNKGVVDEILKKINSNSYIKSKEDEYQRNAEERLIQYSYSTEKINSLRNLKAKRDIYKDLQVNLTTKEARHDPYLTKSIKEVNKELNSMYLYLIGETAVSEQDKSKRTMLSELKDLYERDLPVSKAMESALDEYLEYKYDKNVELFQTKKWISDFNNNNGFSITGSIVTFKPDFYRNKTPMDLINITGEALKRGKHFQKGQAYI